MSNHTTSLRIVVLAGGIGTPDICVLPEKPTCPICGNGLFDCGLPSQPLYCGACGQHRPRPEKPQPVREPVRKALRPGQRVTEKEPYRPGCGYRNRAADRREARALRLARLLVGRGSFLVRG